MQNIASYLLANSYSAFSPAIKTAPACYSNGQPIPCPGWLAGAGMGFFLIIAVLVILMIVSIWKVYTKAGQPGWACIIPIYGFVVMLQIVKKPIWWVILIFIPFVNLIVGLIVAYNLAKVFGKGFGFTLGLIVLPFIFYPILGFGKAQYMLAPAQTAPTQPMSPPPMQNM